MKRLVSTVELVASLLLLGMACLTSISAIARYFFSKPIPDEYEISRLTLGIVACWAIPVAFRYGDHIQLDIFWERIPAPYRGWLTRAGATVCLAAMIFVVWALGAKVIDSYQSGLVSVDLGLPVWPFHAAAWLGTVAAVIVLADQVREHSTQATDLSAE
jgi:TRAP-type C4-dicarboxylate transport system permease small subunit